MIILCDLDQVVIDMLPSWLNLYNREYEDTLGLHDITAWDVSKFVKPECGKEIFKYLHDPALYRFSKPIPGALHGLSELHLRGHEIVYLTHCVGPTMADAKWKWMQSNGFLSLGKMIILSDMGMKSLISGDLMIDDYGENLRAFRGARVLFDQPYNRHESMPRASTWDDILRMVN